MPIDGESQCVILLDWMASKEPTFENLLCVDRDGRVIWKAELPQSHDFYSTFELSADGLHAFSFSCFRVKLDTKTGQILESQFTK